MLTKTRVRRDSLQTRFDYDDRNKAYQLDLNITGLNLRSILPYVRQKIWLGDLQGVANLDLEMRGSTAHLLDFTLRGYAGIRSLDVLDEAGTTMVRCDTVNITVRDMDVPANRIYLSRVHFERPYIHIQYDKDSLDNFNRLIQKAERILYEQDSMRLVARLEAEGITLPPDQPLSELLADSTEQEAESPLVEFNGRARDLHLLIDSLLIDSARLTYRDESLPYMPFVYELSSVNIAAPNFTLNGVNHITADAQLGKADTDIRVEHRWQLIGMKRVIDLVRCPGGDRETELISLNADSASKIVSHLRPAHFCVIAALLRDQISGHGIPNA
jgi:hypothetical protein